MSSVRVGQGTVVLLSGPSSTGKTSIAECLRRLTPRPAVFLNGDELDLPSESLAVTTLRALPARLVVPMEEKFHLGYFGALVAFASNGLHAIGEVLFKSPESFATFTRSVASVPSLVVHVTCDLEIRRAREVERGDRAPGTTDLTAGQEWTPDRFDLTIDTSHTEPMAAATAIAARLT